MWRMPLCDYRAKACSNVFMSLQSMQKRNGLDSRCQCFFDDAQLSWERGERNISYFKLKDTRKERMFCTTCGSPLPRQNEKGNVVLPAGTLDNDTCLEPTAHIFYTSRASWEDKLMHLQRFDELPK